MWTEEDRRWAVALLAEEADECPRCCGPMTETTDPGNEFRYRAEAIRCHKCVAQQREMTDHDKRGNPAGLLVVATLDS